MKKRQYILPEIKKLKAELITGIANYVSEVTINGEDSGISVDNNEEGDGDDQAVSHFNVWDE